MTGHNVSKSNRKTKRVFLPNIQNVAVAIKALGSKLQLKVAARTIRTMMKHGSLENYLLNTKARNLTPFAQSLRRKLKAVTNFVPEKAKFKKPNRSARLIKKVEKRKAANS
jgi:large subunit ribosomal protein L28